MAVLVALVVLLAACTSAEERENRSVAAALARAGAQLDHDGASVLLPAVAPAGLPARTPRVRLRVTAGAVDVDEAPPAIARWRADPRRFLASAPAGSLHTLVPPAPRRVVSLHGGQISAGDRAEGGQGLLVLRLRTALEDLRARDPAVRAQGWTLWAGATVSYRTIVEVLYTAGQSDLGRVAVAVTERGRAAELPIALLRSRQGREPAHDLALTLSVASPGVGVCGSGGCLSSACDGLELGSPSMAVPRRPGEGHDWGRLRRCVAKIKEAFPDETAVIVRGEPTTTWGDILQAVAAARGERGELFPDAELAGLMAASGEQARPEQLEPDVIRERVIRGRTGPETGDAVEAREDFGPDAVVRAVRAHLPAIQTCYERRLAASPTLAGTITVQFTVESTGVVSRAHTIENTTRDQDLADCVVARVGSMGFNPGPDGGSVHFEYPFVFAPDS